MASQNMSEEDVMDEDTFYIVLANSDIQPYFFELEYTAKEMQQASEALLARLIEQQNLVNIGRTGECIALIDYIYHQNWLDFHIKSVKISL